MCVNAVCTHACMHACACVHDIHVTPIKACCIATPKRQLVTGSPTADAKCNNRCVRPGYDEAKGLHMFMYTCTHEHVPCLGVGW